MKVGWLFHEVFLRHDTGPSHVERPARLEAIVDILRRERVLEQLEPVRFEAATPEQLARVHEPAYIDIARMACEEGFSFIGSKETKISPDSYHAATLAAGAAIGACDAVLDGRVRRAFCAVRPPGHHAERDQAMGYCLFNNVAVAAEHLVQEHGLQRIAIVDFDVHHGNGTQHAFEERRDVFYVSIHERPGSLLFPGTGEEREEGRGAGLGFNLNIPMKWGSRDEDYRQAFAEKLIPALDGYRPEFVLVSAGFDALMWDNAAHISLVPESYGWMTRELVAAAERHAGGRLVSVLEGGYELQGLAKAVLEHIRALTEDAGEKMEDRGSRA